MKKIRFTIILFSTSLFLFSCGPSGSGSSAKEKAAADFIQLYEQHRDAGELTAAKAALKKIETGYPDTEIFKRVDSLIVEINDLIALKEKEKVAAIEDARKNMDAYMRKMVKDEDEFKELVFYKHKNAPKYTNTRSSFSAYIGQKEGVLPWVRMDIVYVAKDWLFIKNIQIKADEEMFKITPDHGQMKRDNSGGKIWEWLDKLATTEDLNMLNTIANAQKVAIRFNGDQYYDDFNMSETDKKSLKDVLGLYESMTTLAALEKE